MTLTLLTFLIVTLFWNNTRVAALLTLSLLYLLATFLAWRGLRLKVGQPLGVHQNAERDQEGPRMFGNRELTRLNLRKAELLAESDAIRRGLEANWAQIQSVISWVEFASSFIRQIKPLCLIAAPLLGIWVSRRANSNSGLWSKMRLGWRLWQAVVVAWRKLQSDKT